MKRYHTSKSGGHWALRAEGADRAIKNSATKQEAVEHMQEFMKDRVGTVKIHKQNGQLQEERTYQRTDDPSNRKG